MAASISPLRSSFRICSPLTLHHHCCRAKLRMHRKCESQKRHLHESATRAERRFRSGEGVRSVTCRWVVIDSLFRPYVLLPLILEHINERAVCNAIAPEKDVDGFHIVNIGKLCLDQRSMVPATPAAVWEIIKRAGIETVGKNVLVAGRSKNVGMPIAMLLHTDRHHERPGGDATVTITHRCTPKERLKELTRLADIIIAAAGVPELITADMVKEGAAVIDVGINRIKDPNTGKLRLIGDVDFEGVKERAGFITPVPGGVGPMTVAMLMKNTVTAARNALMH
ncbi:probable bifunctional methylenetetrahydrofolate dehydrogenase/cyclohydrolase 2 [Neolamprologus brichardi]|uniref:probable bifunctional methylenetetrahydrofolate dehydrogenase/cyclohydrolase 2 n=1 Tax=Neolamprologus brichardi TaxID=32507 RepID=UPI0016437579|nr:probable bifunctional methylenetetrahydrofolate dehydrogenase/cyclohydrolase 2 [Neolamprologus brichardi]